MDHHPTNTSPQPDQAATLPRRPDLLLSDLTSELLWPTLFRAATLACRPDRIALAIVTLVLLGLVGSLSSLWSDAPAFGPRAGEIFGGAFASMGLALDQLSLAQPWKVPTGPISTAAFAITLAAPAQLAREYPLSILVLGLPMLATMLVGLSAITRSAATEIAVGTPESASAALARAIRSLPSLMAVALGPALAAGLVAILLASVGWVLLSLPVADLIGAALFGPALVIALVVVIVFVLWVASWPMLPASIMCEGPDSFDALQRGLAYVARRPLRYTMYVLLLAAIGVLLAAIASLIAFAADRFATGASLMWLPAQTATPLAAAPADFDDAPFAARIFNLWRSALALAVGGFVFSYIASATATLYLTMRRLVDGQTAADFTTR
jgi:hypothetical protein